ncbi:MAG: histidine phosphatase family protein [Candidatus Hodarchaeota archaeon]
MVLIRHGQSEANARRILQGHMDSPLTEEGRFQARNIAQRMRNAGCSFDYIYSSDLSRATETTEIIVKVIKANRILYTPLIREFDLGIMVGKSVDKMNSQDRELLDKIWSNPSQRIPNGESLDLFIYRLRTFLHLIENTNPTPSSVLVVSHGGVIYNLLKYLIQGLPEMDEWFKNCEINEIVRPPKSKTWKLIVFNGKRISDNS